MAERPPEPNLPELLRDLVRRVRDLERRTFLLPPGATPLQTLEDGELLGDTLFLDFGPGVTATKVAENYVLVEGAGAGTRWGTVVVAASDTHQAGKDTADFVCDGTDDQTTLDAALDAAPSGGEIVLLEGTYQLSAVWAIDEANVKVRGMGPATIIKAMSGFSGTNALQLLRNHIWLDSVAFLDATPKTKRAVKLSSATVGTGADDCRVTRCIFEDWDFGVGTDGASEISAQRLRVEGCLFDGCDDAISHIATGAADGALFLGNTVRDCTGYGIRWAGGETMCIGNRILNNSLYAIREQAGDGAMILNNFISGGADRGIDITGHEGQCVGNSIIDRTTGILLNGNKWEVSGNVIEDCSGDAIWVSLGEHNITGNWVNNCLRGVLANRGDLLIVGNVIRDCLQEGIRCTDASTTRTDVTIVGNYVMRCGQTADNTYDGIVLNANFDKCNVQGNTVRHKGATNKHRYGINVAAASCDDNVVTNNDLKDSGSTGSFNDAGTGTITAAGNRL